MKLSPLTIFSCTLAISASCFAKKTDEANPRQKEFYIRESIPTPKDNVFEVGAIAIMPNKKVAVATRRGDIWICTGAYEKDLSKVQWSLFASGLHEPLGMFYKDGSLYATTRPEITKLTDTDNDGKADLFTTVNSSWGINGDYHEYNFGSDPDPEGNIWVVHCLTGSARADSHWRGWAVRYSLDGTKAIPTCPGIRSPGGIGFNPEGECFYTDNQGLWNGSSSLKWLKPGSFQGNPTGNKYAKLKGVEEPPKPNDNSTLQAEYEKDNRLMRPAVIIPHALVGQSPTAVIHDNTEGKFGPFKTQMLIGEQTHSQVQRVFMEKVNGFYQGAVWHLLDGFKCGIVAARMGENATLFAGGTNRGWASRGGKTFTFERVRWTGKTPFEMHEIKATPTGFQISFTDKIKTNAAADPESYKIRAWTYQYRSGYGSKKDINPVEPAVTKVEVSADKKSVKIHLDTLINGHIYHININGVESVANDNLWHPDVYYTLNEIPSKN